MKQNIRISDTKAFLDEEVAAWLTDLAAASNGPFRVALSGGSTPKSMYQLLAQEPLCARMPWGRVHWYWGDERYVPHDAPASNYAMAWTAFLSKAPVPARNIHGVTFEGTPKQAAKRYEAELKQAYGSDTLDPARPFFDVNLLGMGPDGHTASLLPGAAVLDERKAWVSAVDHGRPEPRITLTYPVLASSRHVAFMVSGAEKAPALARAVASDPALPAGRVQPDGDLTWFVDKEAAAKLPQAKSAPPVLLVMGVSGSGKTTIGEMLAKRLGWTFKEGDDLHPQANIEKMHAGIPLDDEDRQPWLAAIAEWIDQQTAMGRPAIVSCSALKRAYRDFLRADRPQIRLVYLKGSFAVLAERLSHRQGHFMPTNLLDSQFDTLEEPAPDENALVADDNATPQEIVDDIMDLLSMKK